MSGRGKRGVGETGVGCGTIGCVKTKVVDAPVGEGIQYLTDEHGKRIAVILTMDAWETLLTRIEDAEDLLDVAQARASGEADDVVPWEEIEKELDL